MLSFFSGFLAYGVAAIFVVLNGLFLWIFEGQYNLIEIGQASLIPFFTLAPWILIFLIPALTMKSFAEEYQQGSWVWLMSKPISLFQIVLAKFLAVFAVVVLCIVSVYPFLYSLFYLAIPEGNMDLGAIVSGVIGLLLTASVMISLGIFASSISKNQIGAYLAGVLLCFLMFQGMESLASYKLFGSTDYVLQSLGISYPYSSFVKGVIELRFLLYLLILSGFFFGLGYYFLLRRKKNI